jgi:3-polyprenyl-4-hydroxybenzoate decarboxylase
MFAHATSEIGAGTKLGLDATRKLPCEGFKRPRPPLIRMDQTVKASVKKTFQLAVAEVTRCKSKARERK